MKTIKISDDSYEAIKSQLKDEEKIVEKKKVNIEIKNRWTGDIIYSSEKTTMKEAVEESVKSEADLSEADLSKADLSEADLFEANLSKANLFEANLSKANLFEANLSKANLSKADLSEADLSEADLSEADLFEADLFEAKFWGKTDTPIILKENQIDDFLGALGFKRK